MGGGDYVFLKHLQLIRDDDFNYQAQGNIYGDRSFQDGTLIITGDVEMIDFDNCIILAQGRRYGFQNIMQVIEED